MSKLVFERLQEGALEILAWSRGEIALPVTDYKTSPPTKTVRYRSDDKAQVLETEGKS